MSDVKDWNVAAASNNSASPDGFPEGMAPSGLNNASREVMAAVARLYADINGSLDTTGVANTYALTPNNTFTAYTRGDMFRVEINVTNTGASTLNVSSLGTKSIVDVNGNAMVGGELIAGGVYDFVYDGTNMIVLNPYTGITNTTSGSKIYNGSADANLVIETGNTNSDSYIDLLGDANGGVKVLWDESASIGYIQQTDATGSGEDVWIALTKDGAVTLGYDNTVRIETTADGGEVTGTLIDLDNSGASTATRITARNSAGGASFRSAATTGNLEIRQTDSAGALEATWITAARGGAVNLYNNNVVEFNSQDSDAATNTTGAQVRHNDQTFYDVGLNVMPVLGSAAALDLDEVHAGKLIRKTTASDIDITTTANNCPNGAMFMIANESGGSCIMDATGVTLTWLDGGSGGTGDRTLADNGVCTIVKRSTGQYLIWGSGLS